MASTTFLRYFCFGLIATLGPALFSPVPATDNDASGEVRQLIVKLRTQKGARAAMVTRDITRGLSASAGVNLDYVRAMSNGAQVFRLPQSATAAQVDAVVQQLSHDPTVELVEPDRWVRPLLVPNDPLYQDQWHLQDAASEVASANLPGAWDINTGANNLIIAVVDNGLIAHADIDRNTRVLPGYDFVSDAFVANDGDGRDSDPTDPGDWITSSDRSAQSLCASTEDSTWHGTHVAGIIAATGNNALGVTGINWNSKLLPVRVLGKCGGYLSDVIDGARWAAGLSVSGVTDNPNPARVINMSLGSKTACSPFVQGAVNEILATGAVIVVAAGNGNGDANAIAPGNCSGVISVAAVDRNGDRAYYSSTGSTVALSAPGGAQMFINDSRGILSLSNTGSTSPDASPAGDRYAFLQGTSMSAPIVSGVASLMLSINPALTPAQIRQKLRATARPFSAGSTCTTVSCGAGMVDALAAVQSAYNATSPVANAGDDKQVDLGAAVTLDASRSSSAPLTTIVQYRWAQVSGTQVSLSDPQSVTPTFTAPTAADLLRFELTVTDNSGLSSTDTVDVRLGSGVYSATTSSGSGGGGGGGGCFIATAAYGSADATEVRTLRIFRDRYLLTNKFGRAFVMTYYRLSPTFADAIRPRPMLRAMVRTGLIPYVTIARWFGVSVPADAQH